MARQPCAGKIARGIWHQQFYRARRRINCLLALQHQARRRAGAAASVAWRAEIRRRLWQRNGISKRMASRCAMAWRNAHAPRA